MRRYYKSKDARSARLYAPSARLCAPSAHTPKLLAAGRLIGVDDTLLAVRAVLHRNRMILCGAIVTLSSIFIATTHIPVCTSIPDFRYDTGTGAVRHFAIFFARKYLLVRTSSGFITAAT